MRELALYKNCIIIIKNNNIMLKYLMIPAVMLCCIRLSNSWLAICLCVSDCGIHNTHCSSIYDVFNLFWMPFYGEELAAFVCGEIDYLTTPLAINFVLI